MKKTITNENFQELLAQGLPMLVDFSAIWCGPCKMLSPLVDQLADEYEGKAIVGGVDVNDCQDLAMEYGVHSLPTIIFFKDGKPVDRLVGAVPKNVIEDQLKALL